MSITSHTKIVKETASLLGFDFCGIAKAGFLEDDAKRLETWLNKGMQGYMDYMARHFDLRIDPKKLVPGAKSVITLLINYFPEKFQRADAPKISKYAYSKDYHDVIRAKLNHFFYLLRENIVEINSRGFLDCAPVIDRA